MHLPKSPGIYCIVNLNDGRHYVGSSKDLRTRKNAHWSELLAGRHNNKKLQRSWAKHGEQAFRFDVLELTDLQALVVREQFYLDKTLPYYNILRVAHSALGYRHTEKEMIASRVRNKAYWANMSPEARKEYSAMLGASRLGGKLSEETCKRMSIAKSGIVKSAEWREALSVSHAQSYIVTSPDGVETAIVGLAKFCRANGLSQGNLGMTICGKRNHHKGWKCRKA